MKVSIKDVTSGFLVWGIWSTHPNDTTLNTNEIVKWEALSSIGCVDQRMNRMGLRIVLPADKNPQVNDSFEKGSPQDYLIHRIMNGVAESPKDIFPLDSLPFESNLDFYNAVNFDKGCYLGQELTARTFHRGVTRKRIMPLQFAKSNEEFRPNTTEPVLNRNFNEKLPESGTQLVLDQSSHSEETGTEKAIGHVGGTIFNIGLGLVRLNIAKEPNTVLKVGEFKVKPFIPSWWPPLPPNV